MFKHCGVDPELQISQSWWNLNLCRWTMVQHSEFLIKWFNYSAAVLFISLEFGTNIIIDNTNVVVSQFFSGWMFLCDAAGSWLIHIVLGYSVQDE